MTTKNVVETVKPVAAQETEAAKIKSLDGLLELLNQDDLRHVVGGLRPDGPPHNSMGK